MPNGVVDRTQPNAAPNGFTTLDVALDKSKLDFSNVRAGERKLQFSVQAAEAVGLLKALANEPRLLVLCHLAEGQEMAVGDLARKVGLSQSALSQHLAKLREQNLVTTRKNAQTVFYSVCDPKALQVLSLLHDLFCPELGQTVATESNRS